MFPSSSPSSSQVQTYTHTSFQVLMKALHSMNYHITYCGSIFSSFAIMLLLCGFKDCGDWYQHNIDYFVTLKCFFLYDSTKLELIHHAIQYFLIQVFQAKSNMFCAPHILTNYKLGYAMMITPMFQNIKKYIKPSEHNHNQILDYLTFFSFLYVRGRFNYVYLFGNGTIGINDFIIMNFDPIYHFYILIGVHIGMITICGMNVYWGYKICKNFYTNVFINIGR